MPDLPPISVQDYPAIEQPLLTLQGVSCQRGSRSIFSNLSLQLSAGQALQIKGANGAGKTSLLRLAAGLLSPTSGALNYLGESVLSNPHVYRSELLFLGHQSAVKSQLTALENLLHCVDSRHHFCEQEVMSALAEVGLAGYEDLPCSTFSAGQKRRVALAMLLLSRARVWLLDEPFTAIDKKGVKLLEKWMLAHLAKGGGIILTSHQDVELPGLTTIDLREESDSAQ